jgi:hypothetical protein
LPPPGTTNPPSGTTPVTPILKTTSGGGTNMALIIGVIVGALGFLSLGGFVVYYIIKRKRMEADRLAEEDPDEDYSPVKKF